jgi:hypothetical protein
MSIRIYVDNTNYIIVKAGKFDELVENFKKGVNALNANFYSFHNKKIGSQILSDLDLTEMVKATDIEYIPTYETDYTNEKDNRNIKSKFEDNRNDGKSRNKLSQMRVQKSVLEKTLHKLQRSRDSQIKERIREDKNMKRYTGKEVQKEGHEILDENVKEILAIENHLHRFAMDKLRLKQKKYLMKTTRNNVVYV